MPIIMCLKKLGVISGESRDGLGQERFLPLMPQWIGPGLPRWEKYSESAYFKPTLRDCCSNSLISFHPASECDFDLWEYFLHRVRVFGYPRPPLGLPQRLDLRPYMPSCDIGPGMGRITMADLM